MARALGLAVALVLLLVPAAEAAVQPTGELRAGAEESVLRLHDLPPGYVVDERSCYAPLPDGAARALGNWLLKYRPESCDFEYDRRYRVPGQGPAPPEAGGEVVNTPSEAAAAEGFGIFRRLIARVTDWDPQGTASLGPAGARAILFRTEERIDGEREPASVVFWRHGKLIAIAHAAGMKPRDNDQAALHFAQIQQGRMEAPSPLADAEMDDTQVPLDDPALKVPVYWLGSRFAPGGGLRATELEGASVIEGRGEGPPGQKLALGYEDFQLGTWTRRGWKSFKRSVLGPLSLKARCARTTEVELEEGSAVVYAGYGRVRFRSCPDRPPDRYWAIAHVGRVVIGVNLAHCTRCVSPGPGPYSSLQGMKATLRGLTLRPKPVY